MPTAFTRIIITVLVLLSWELYQNRAFLQISVHLGGVATPLPVAQPDEKTLPLRPCSAREPALKVQSGASVTQTDLNAFADTVISEGSRCQARREEAWLAKKRLRSLLCPDLAPSTVIEFDRSKYEGPHNYYLPQRPSGETTGGNHPVQGCVDRLLAWLRRADHDHWETIGWSRDDYIFGEVWSVDKNRNVWEFFSRREQRRAGELIHLLIHYSRYVEQETVFLVTTNDVDLWTMIANYAARKADFEQLLNECPIWYLHWNPTVDLKTGRLPKRTLPIPDPYRYDTWLLNKEVQPSGKADQPISSTGGGKAGAKAGSTSSSIVKDHAKKTLLFREQTSGFFVPLEKSFRDTDRYRIVATLLGAQCREDLSGLVDLDVGFTEYVHGVDKEVAPWEAPGPASAIEAARAHAVLDVDGGADAWEDLRWKLGLGAVVVKVPSSRGAVQWYYKDLKDGVHLKLLPPLPTLDAGSQTKEAVAQYCRQVRDTLEKLSNAEYRANISASGRRFAQEHFTTAAVDDYLSELIPNVWKKEAELRMQDWRISRS